VNVSLGKVWEQYVADQIESGLFGNASEVVRDALRRQQEHLLKLEALKRDVRAGVDSLRAGNVSRSSPEDIIRKVEGRRRTA
jgi:antitoxin ParD1/3/4